MAFNLQIYLANFFFIVVLHLPLITADSNGLTTEAPSTTLVVTVAVATAPKSTTSVNSSDGLQNSTTTEIPGSSTVVTQTSETSTQESLSSQAEDNARGSWRRISTLSPTFPPTLFPPPVPVLKMKKMDSLKGYSKELSEEISNNVITGSFKSPMKKPSSSATKTNKIKSNSGEEGNGILPWPCVICNSSDSGEPQPILRKNETLLSKPGVQMGVQNDGNTTNLSFNSSNSGGATITRLTLETISTNNSSMDHMSKPPGSGDYMQSSSTTKPKPTGLQVGHIRILFPDPVQTKRNPFLLQSATVPSINVKIPGLLPASEPLEPISGSFSGESSSKKTSSEEAYLSESSSEETGRMSSREIFSQSNSFEFSSSDDSSAEESNTERSPSASNENSFEKRYSSFRYYLKHTQDSNELPFLLNLLI